MSALSKLSHDDIRTVLAPFGIDTIESFSLLNGGSENTNYKIVCPNHRYVLTICEQKSQQKGVELVQLLDFLKANNFTSSQAIRTLSGQETSVWQEKAVIVKTFIDGEILADLSDDLLNNLGAQLAGLHLLKAPSYLPDTLSYGLEKFDEIAVYAADSEFHRWLLAIRRHTEKYIDTDLPKALIHSDVFYNNIIVDAAKNQATIMDFEEASYYYRIFDIGMIIIGTCCLNNQLDMHKARSLIAGYQQNSTLSHGEIKALQVFTTYAAAATAFWRHQNYNYTNFDPTMTDHYLAMQLLGQQVMAIPSADFINQLALSNLD